MNGLTIINGELISNDKLLIFVPSQQTAIEYNNFFETDKIKPIKLRVKVPEIYRKVRPASDFNTIKFMMSGIPSDGRKGQLLFLAGLQLFESKYKANNPNKFRPYTIDMIAIGDDYISEQIKAIGKSFLGKNLHIHPVVPFKVALQITNSCNVTVCTSLNETFGLFLAEGMLMGHLLLRNHTSGWQEQIQDGKNGYLFDDLDVDDLAKKISYLLDIKNSNFSLAKMSLESQKIARNFVSADYFVQLYKKNN